eukprot:TRINITY_DN4272_c0_g1_i12.p1 TRINITY_DN4272_c0_g1~~TRINITY_DN4272_c0_g1_i12.p1  ORF type:complete len:607 (-),score=227.76 TRINITY_DN4272_c0_g1_i12:104-1924(-)
MDRYPHYAELLDKCCYALANLAFNNQPNMNSIVSQGGVTRLVSAMTTHPDHIDLQDSGTCCLSNLCFNADQNKALIGREGGPRVIVQMMSRHAQQRRLLESGLQALGNLAFCRDNVPIIVNDMAVGVIVAALRSHLDNPALLQLGIAVLGNLAAEANEPEVVQRIVDEGALQLVVESCLQHPQTMDLQTCALGCLGNLTANPEHSALMIEAGAGRAIISTMTALDWEEQLLDLCLKVLAAMAGSDEANARLLVQAQASKKVLTTLQAHKNNTELLKQSLVCLSKLSVTNETAWECAQQGAIDVVIQIAEEYQDDDKILGNAITVLSNLSVVEENAHTIAQRSGRLLIHSLRTFITNQVFLRTLSSCFGALAIFTASARVLLDLELVPAVVEAIRANMEYPALLVKFIRTLSNLCMADHSALTVVEAAQGPEVTRSLIRYHPHNVQLIKGCEVLQKKLQELEVWRNMPQDQGTNKIGIKNDVPIVVRNMLVAGTLFKKHCSNAAPRKRHVKITDDFEALIWEDPSKKKEPQRTPLSWIREVVPGACTPQLQRKVFGHKQAVPECSFAIFFKNADEKPLNLEAQSAEQAAKWISAVELLIRLNDPTLR